jgi:hypothetical protein
MIRTAQNTFVDISIGASPSTNQSSFVLMRETMLVLGGFIIPLAIEFSGCTPRLA